MLLFKNYLGIFALKFYTYIYMNFIINSSSLLKQLQVLSGVLNSSNTLPILDNFLFEIESNDLTISASDLETTMTTKMNVDSKEDGNIAIPAKILLDTLKSLPEQPLSITVDHSTMGIEISSDYGKYKLIGQNPDEFPKSPEMENPSKLLIDSDILAEAINKTIFATGNDELRPVMTGVFFELDKDYMRFVATDAHKLVRYTRKDAKATKTGSFILPKKPLNLLKNVVVNSEEDINIQFTDSNAVFSFENIILHCRLIEGKYPNYEAVIPKENPNKLLIDRKSLLQSIKRVSIFSNKSTHQVRLKITGSELTISAEDLDFANEANERLTCSYEGEDMEIGFNSKFLMEMLNSLSGENVIIELSASNRAGILLPEQNENESEDILMLVMPVMLNA